MRIIVKERKLTLQERIIINLRETWRNKIFALTGIILGLIMAFVTGDGTGLVFFTIIICIPLFFAKKDVWRNS